MKKSLIIKVLLVFIMNSFLFKLFLYFLINALPGTEPIIVKAFKLFEIGNSFKQFIKYLKNQTKLYRICKSKSK